MKKSFLDISIKLSFRNIILELVKFVGDKTIITLEIASPISQHLAEHILKRLKTLQTAEESPVILFKLLQEENYKKILNDVTKDIENQLIVYKEKTHTTQQETNLEALSATVIEIEEDPKEKEQTSESRLTLT